MFVAAPAPEILLYHRVSDEGIDNQYLSVSRANFEAHLDILRHDRKVVPLFDLVQAVQKGHLPPNAVALTFDDGYADNLLNALPLLEKYQCHATIFVTTGLLGHPYGFWYDVLEDVLFSHKNLPPTLCVPMLNGELPLSTPEEVLATHEILLNACKQAPAHMRRLLLHEVVMAVGRDPAAYTSPHPVLTREQVRELAASPFVEIGAHTCTHSVLAQLDEAAQRREITESVKLLESILGKAPRILAYPFGNSEAYSDVTKRVTREAGLLGIANIQGSLQTPLDPQDVPRRLVRNWTASVFRRWLRASDRHQLERETVGQRTDMLLRHLRQKTFCDAPRYAQVPATEQPLRITHINTMLGKGGTAGVMQLLAEMQQAAGHDARMLVGHIHAPHAGGEAFDTAPHPRREAEARREGLTDYHLQGSHTLSLHPAVAGADVLHVHNLHGGYFNPWSLANISRQHPTVWTLHDMHALTGHCAHAFDCPRWRTGCGLCPDLEVYPATAVDNTHRLWRDKQRIYACSPLHVVVPSRWLGNYVGQSLLAEHQCTVIPNGIDVSIFAPRDKAAVRARLGIAPDTLVVGSAAYNGPLHNFWKGGSFALEALESLRAAHPNVLFLGRGNAQEAEVPHVRLLPYAFDKHDMADFYSVLDVMIYPSLADNCPLVVMEAMACGVPVLAFGVGGIPELLEEGGVLVPPRDGAALCRAALELAASPETRQKLGGQARQRAENFFDARLMARRYEALYVQMRAEYARLPQMQNTLHSAEVTAMASSHAFDRLAEKTGLWK